VTLQNAAVGQPWFARESALITPSNAKPEMVNLKKNRVRQDKGTFSGYRFALSRAVSTACKVIEVIDADNLENRCPYLLEPAWPAR
jgi:hypothetical protein